MLFINIGKTLPGISTCQSCTFHIFADHFMFSRSLITATIKPLMLAILSDGEAYGYQIIQRVQRLSEGEIDLTTGTLYPHLHRMEADGLVKSEWKEVPDAPRRKYYQLTRAGRKALTVEKQQWIHANAILAGLWGPAASAGGQG